MVAFKTPEGVVKVHVHTMTPGRVLDYCQQFGEFLTLKIENMMLQHNESDLATWTPVEYELNRTYATENAAEFPYLAALRALLRRQTDEKIAGGVSS